MKYAQKQTIGGFVGTHTVFEQQVEGWPGSNFNSRYTVLAARYVERDSGPEAQLEISIRTRFASTSRHEVAGMALDAKGAAKMAAAIYPPAFEVRYCPECGSIGEVPEGARDCCPTGSRAVRVPRAVAEQARAGFLASIYPSPALKLVVRVARLNPDAGEIGAGMLAQLVDEARRVIDGTVKT